MQQFKAGIHKISPYLLLIDLCIVKATDVERKVSRIKSQESKVRCQKKVKSQNLRLTQLLKVKNQESRVKCQESKGKNQESRVAKKESGVKSKESFINKNARVNRKAIHKSKEAKFKSKESRFRQGQKSRVKNKKVKM